MAELLGGTTVISNGVPEENVYIVRNFKQEEIEIPTEMELLDDVGDQELDSGSTQSNTPRNEPITKDPWLSVSALHEETMQFTSAEGILPGVDLKGKKTKKKKRKKRRIGPYPKKRKSILSNGLLENVYNVGNKQLTTDNSHIPPKKRVSRKIQKVSSAISETENATELSAFIQQNNVQETKEINHLKLDRRKPGRPSGSKTNSSLSKKKHTKKFSSSDLEKRTTRSQVSLPSTQEPLVEITNVQEENNAPEPTTTTNEPEPNIEEKEVHRNNIKVTSISVPNAQTVAAPESPSENQVLSSYTDILDKVCAAVNQPNDEFEGICISWTEKLRKLEPVQKVLAEDLINRVFRKAFFNELTRRTRLIEDESQIITIRDSSPTLSNVSLDEAPLLSHSVISAARALQDHSYRNSRSHKNKINK